MGKVCELADKLIAWLRERVADAGAKGVILGVSGGLDSAVAAAVCKEAFPGNALGLIMPCYSMEEDVSHAHLVLEHLELPWKTVVLDRAYDVMLETLGEDVASKKPPTLARANLKPRLRMITLYYYAALYNYLVIGTTNLSERKVGYFTKHGDGGVDLLLLGNLIKDEVRSLATYFAIPEVIINKPPSGGLWPGQTDEKEMGLTYEELDAYMLGEKIADDTWEKIHGMRKRSSHKRLLPPIPEFRR